MQALNKPVPVPSDTGPPLLPRGNRVSRSVPIFRRASGIGAHADRSSPASFRAKAVVKRKAGQGVEAPRRTARNDSACATPQGRHSFASRGSPVRSRYAPLSNYTPRRLLNAGGVSVVQPSSVTGRAGGAGWCPSAHYGAVPGSILRAAGFWTAGSVRRCWRRSDGGIGYSSPGEAQA